MIIDKKGKLFGKINIIDICVVLIIVVAIAVTYFKFNLSAHSDVTKSNATVVYTLEACNVRDFTIDGIKAGDKLFDEETDKFIGTIVSVDSDTAFDYITRTDGTIVKADMPERKNLIITVECPAIIREGAVVTESGKQIYLNQNNVCYTQTVQTEFKTIAINEIVDK